jgi:hypothetical protein
MLANIGAALGLFVVFLGWFVYHMYIKRDMKENMNNLFAGLFFIAIWFAMYVLLFQA